MPKILCIAVLKVRAILCSEGVVHLSGMVRDSERCHLEGVRRYCLIEVTTRLITETPLEGYAPRPSDRLWSQCVVAGN